MPRVVHLNRGHGVLIQDFSAPHVPFALAALPGQYGPTAPPLIDPSQVPIPRSMREDYYLPKDVDRMAGVVSYAPEPIFVTTPLPQFDDVNNA